MIDHHLPTTPPLPIGEVVFIKLTTFKKDFINTALKTYKHMSYKEIMKMFGVSEKVAKIKNKNIYFNIDPNMMGYIVSERKKKEDEYGNMLGYEVKWETLNSKLPLNTGQTFAYESSLLSISDIVILDIDNLYEEMTGEKTKRKAQ